MERRRPRVTILVPILFGIVIGLALIIFIASSVQAANQITQDLIYASNRTLVSVSANLMFNPLYELDAWTMNRMLQEFISDPEILYVGVRDATGQILADVRREGWLPQGQTNKDLARQSFAQQIILNREYEDTLIMAGPISSGSEVIGSLEIVFDPTSVQGAITALTQTMGITGTIIVLVIVTSSFLFTRYANRSLQSLVKAAKEIGQGNMDFEIPIIELEEMAVVGEALDKMRTDLQQLYAEFERQLQNIEKRAGYLETTAAIARDATSVLDEGELLNRAINMIHEHFAFYRQSIYLLDRTKTWAILYADAGEESAEALEQDFQLEVGVEGIIGQVTATGQPYVSRNIKDDPIFVSDGRYGKVQSELVLPLIARGEIIGALDVQSIEIDDFSTGDINVLQTLADQIAMAISNANLFQQAQENFDILNRAYGELSRESWSELLRGQLTLGYYCNENGVMGLDRVPTSAQRDDLPALDFPVVMRGGQVLGTIKVRKPNPGEAWSPDEINMLQTITDQMSLALESAQLYQDTQKSATRQQLAREITDKMRRATSVEDIVQTAINELYLALGASQKVKAKLEVQSEENASI
jgi:GAF domain-containing protein/HAMP domain-containing protein